MFTISRRKLLARAFMNYSTVCLTVLVVSQLPLLGTGRFSFPRFIFGIFMTFGWILTAFLIQPEEE